MITTFAGKISQVTEVNAGGGVKIPESEYLVKSGPAYEAKAVVDVRMETKLKAEMIVFMNQSLTPRPELKQQSLDLTRVNFCHVIGANFIQNITSKIDQSDKQQT